MRLALFTIAVPLLVACAGGGGGDDDTGPDPTTEHCLSPMPIDGVTDVPAGWLVAGWFGLDPVSEEEIGEVAFQTAWPAPALVCFRLADMEPPSAAIRWSVECGAATIDVAIGVTELLADADGTITDEEFLFGHEAGVVYGVGEAIIVDAPVGCDVPIETPPFRDGIRAGRHVYAGNEESFFTLADGASVDLATCRPGSAACDQLEGPI